MLREAGKIAGTSPSVRVVIREAEEMIASGQSDDAILVLEKAMRGQQRAPSATAAEVSRRLDEAIAALRRERVPPRPSSNAFNDLRSFLAIPNGVPAPHRALMVPLQQANGKRPFVVTREQKTFATKYSRGAATPDLYLDSCVSREFSSAWRLARPDQRVFLIGARSDATRLNAAAAELRKKGYLVFFYLDWEVNGRLCPSEVVGAYFATAGEALVSQSLAAMLSSQFVPVEITASQFARAGEELWYMYTPGELLAIGTGVSGTAVVTVYTVQQAGAQ
jgi:hypothetical protein